MGFKFAEIEREDVTKIENQFVSVGATICFLLNTLCTIIGTINVNNVIADII